MLSRNLLSLVSCRLYWPVMDLRAFLSIGVRLTCRHHGYQLAAQNQLVPHKGVITIYPVCVSCPSPADVSRCQESFVLPFVVRQFGSCSSTLIVSFISSYFDVYVGITVKAMLLLLYFLRLMFLDYIRGKSIKVDLDVFCTIGCTCTALLWWDGITQKGTLWLLICFNWDFQSTSLRPSFIYLFIYLFFFLSWTFLSY